MQVQLGDKQIEQRTSHARSQLLPENIESVKEIAHRMSIIFSCKIRRFSFLAVFVSLASLLFNDSTCFSRYSRNRVYSSRTDSSIFSVKESSFTYLLWISRTFSCNEYPHVSGRSDWQWPPTSTQEHAKCLSLPPSSSLSLFTNLTLSHKCMYYLSLSHKKYSKTHTKDLSLSIFHTHTHEHKHAHTHIQRERNEKRKMIEEREREKHETRL